MGLLLVSIFSLSLLLDGSVGLKWRMRDAKRVGQTLCPSYPYPATDPSTVQQILTPYLDELGRNMSSLIKSTPGGAVVSVVYRDTVIWTFADGLINMSGELVSFPPDNVPQQHFMLHNRPFRSDQRSPNV